MAISRSDELDLLTALHDGVHQEPRWRDFLPRLRRRLRAEQVALLLAAEGATGSAIAQWVDGRGPSEGTDDLEATLGSLRPDRVYSAAEVLAFAAGDGERQRDRSPPAGDRFGRYLRVVDRERRSGWLVATRTREDFGAADGALLAALAPHLSIAVYTLGVLEHGRFRCAVGDETMRRAGIGWHARDRAGRSVDAGGVAERLVGAPAIGIAAPPAAAGTPPLAIVLTRTARPVGDGAVAELARLYGLSRGEARLAVHLAGGLSLSQAATTMGLTVETTRNYSKRLFAKTDTRGQPDLVRLVLTSVAALA